jgi:hypothetical protein
LGGFTSPHMDGASTTSGNYVLDVELKWAYPFLNRG